MENLITVNYDNERPLVSARELHEFLEVKTAYKDWFPRMCNYGFDENADYIAIAQKRATAQGNMATYYDHQLTTENPCILSFHQILYKLSFSFLSS